MGGEREGPLGVPGHELSPGDRRAAEEQLLDQVGGLSLEVNWSSQPPRRGWHAGLAAEKSFSFPGAASRAHRSLADAAAGSHRVQGGRPAQAGHLSLCFVFLFRLYLRCWSSDPLAIECRRDEELGRRNRPCT